MTRLPPILVAASMALSAGLHLAALAVLTGEPPVRQEGGAPAEIAALGSSFADLAAGAIPAAAPSETAPSPRAKPAVRPGPAPSDPVRASRVTPRPEAPEPPASEAAVARATTADPPPSSAARSAAPPDTRSFEVAPAPASSHPRAASAPVASRVAAVSPVAPPSMSEPARPAGPRAAADRRRSTTVTQPADAAEARPATPSRPVEAASPEMAARVPVDRRLLAASETAPEASLRPPRRPIPHAAAPAGAPAGNADRSARAGEDAGRREAEAARAASRPTDSAATLGNAAASDYPGLVMRHVSRVRRPDVAARGAARVTFSISGSGALAGARLSRSSGSAPLDRAALTVIRRAAPFPQPPAGAPRTFTVEIRGR
jgi:protein TonB